MKEFFNEFKSFAMRGNVIDMAVGVVIGAAFGKIVSSLVSNVIMPPLGLILGGIDFSNFFINLGKTPVKTLQEAQAANVPVLAYGAFLNTVIEFLIISFAIFIMVVIVCAVLRAVRGLFSSLLPAVSCGAKHDLTLVALTRSFVGIAQTQ